MSAKDPRDFGPTPKPTPKFKLPADLPKPRSDLLALVKAQGKFPPRAARWLSPAELRLLLTDAFPFESSTVYAVRDPRTIADRDALLTLCAERRVNYYAGLRARRATTAKTAQPTTNQPAS